MVQNVLIFRRGATYRTTGTVQPKQSLSLVHVDAGAWSAKRSTELERLFQSATESFRISLEIIVFLALGAQTDGETVAEDRAVGDVIACADLIDVRNVIRGARARQPKLNVGTIEPRAVLPRAASAGGDVVMAQLEVDVVGGQLRDFRLDALRNVQKDVIMIRKPCLQFECNQCFRFQGLG